MSYLPAYHPAYLPTYVCHKYELHRQQEARDSADSMVDLKAAWAQEVAEVKRQAEEQQQQASSEAQVKLAAAQASRDKLQAQVDRTQESNSSLHKQLADAHGKVCVCVCMCAHCLGYCFGAWADAPVYACLAAWQPWLWPTEIG